MENFIQLVFFSLFWAVKTQLKTNYHKFTASLVMVINTTCCRIVSCWLWIYAMKCSKKGRRIWKLQAIRNKLQAKFLSLKKLQDFQVETFSDVCLHIKVEGEWKKFTVKIYGYQFFVICLVSVGDSFFQKNKS